MWSSDFDSHSWRKHSLYFCGKTQIFYSFQQIGYFLLNLVTLKKKKYNKRSWPGFVFSHTASLKPLLLFRLSFSVSALALTQYTVSGFKSRKVNSVLFSRTFLYKKTSKSLIKFRTPRNHRGNICFLNSLYIHSKISLSQTLGWYSLRNINLLWTTKLLPNSKVKHAAAKRIPYSPKTTRSYFISTYRFGWITIVLPLVSGRTIKCRGVWSQTACIKVLPIAM